MKLLSFRPAMALAMLVGLTGCLTADDMRNRWTFSCPGDYRFEVVYSSDGDAVEFKDDEQELKLERMDSASGASYTDGDLVFWSKGSKAIIEVSDAKVHGNCQGEPF